MSLVDSLRLLSGAVLTALVLFDVFQTIVVPRATSRRFRIAPALYGLLLWPALKWFSALGKNERWRQELRGLFAPAAFICLFVVWLALLQVGFGMIFFAMRDQIHPPLMHFTDACYFAGVCVLTIGFGDVVPITVAARLGVIVAAVCGLMFMALLVSHLFTLQTQLQFREHVVNEMASRGGSPASGVVLLLRYKELEIMPELNAEFSSWESWLGQILESHRAFPVLLYFRSTSQQDSWLSVTGALLDAANLLTSAIRSEPRGRAELFYSLACQTVQSMCQYFELEKDDSWHIAQPEFNQAMDLLAYSGFEISDRDLAWKIFSLKREGYSGYIQALSHLFDTPRQAWLQELRITHFAEETEVKMEIAAE